MWKLILLAIGVFFLASDRSAYGAGAESATPGALVTGQIIDQLIGDRDSCSQQVGKFIQEQQIVILKPQDGKDSCPQSPNEPIYIDNEKPYRADLIRCLRNRFRGSINCRLPEEEREVADGKPAGSNSMILEQLKGHSISLDLYKFQTANIPTDLDGRAAPSPNPVAIPSPYDFQINQVPLQQDTKH